MPVDPVTGQRLPGKAGLYAGEPGAPADAPPAPEGGEPPGLVPERDVKPIADEIDRILAMEEAAAPVDEEPTGPDTEPAEGEEAGEEVDVSPIAEKLGVDSTKARELWDAAQIMPATQDLSPDELANKLIDDFDLRMKLEKLAAGELDQSEMSQLVAASMPEPEAAPGEVVPGPGMPPV